MRLDDETEVLIQVGDQKLRGSSYAQDLPKDAARLEGLACGAAAIARTLRERVSPNKLELEVSLGLSGEVGWFFAKSNVDAVVKLTLTWEEQPEPKEK